MRRKTPAISNYFKPEGAGGVHPTAIFKPVETQDPFQWRLVELPSGHHPIGFKDYMQHAGVDFGEVFTSVERPQFCSRSQ